MKKQILRISIAGSVDDGKSTLLGRLLFDSKQLKKDDIERIRKRSKIKGDIDFSLFTDGLRDEVSQGITIDVAYRYFSTKKRKFIIADTPGHIQYTRNMITGSSLSNLMILLIDVKKGVLEQTKRHLFIASLMYIKHVIICVNKMDLVDFSEEKFNDIKFELQKFISKLTTVDITIIPVSAIKGDNIVKRSNLMSWYQGPTLLYMLENIHIDSDVNKVQSRMFIQNTIQHDNLRYLQGRVNSGIFRKGDELLIHPNSHSSKIIKIINGYSEVDQCFAPMSVSLIIDEDIDLSRGNLITKSNNKPRESKIIDSMICWMTEKNFNMKKNYWFIRHGQKIKSKFINVQYVYNIEDLSREKDRNEIYVNDIFKSKIKLANTIFYDHYNENKETGSFIIVDDENNTVACGMIT
jgi:sulfate adenylyltransferase subunit 1